MQTTTKHLFLYSHVRSSLAGIVQRLLLLTVAVLCLCSRLTAFVYQPQTHATTEQHVTAVTPKLRLSNELMVPLQEIEGTWIYESEPAAEEDEDDKKINTDEFRFPFLNSIYSESRYTSYIKTRLQQLTLQKKNHPFVSYLVLFHCWKSHLV